MGDTDGAEHQANTYETKFHGCTQSTTLGLVIFHAFDINGNAWDGHPSFRPNGIFLMIPEDLHDHYNC
jgi:hypothetical protein